MNKVRKKEEPGIWGNTQPRRQYVRRSRDQKLLPFPSVSPSCSDPDSSFSPNIRAPIASFLCRSEAYAYKWVRRWWRLTITTQSSWEGIWKQRELHRQLCFEHQWKEIHGNVLQHIITTNHGNIFLNKHTSPSVLRSAECLEFPMILQTFTGQGGPEVQILKNQKVTGWPQLLNPRPCRFIKATGWWPTHVVWPMGTGYLNSNSPSSCW